jgi:hypothetical protein
MERTHGLGVVLAGPAPIAPSSPLSCLPPAAAVGVGCASSGPLVTNGARGGGGGGRLSSKVLLGRRLKGSYAAPRGGGGE